MYAAGDLSDPHGTHRTCLQALFRALESAMGQDWYRACATEVLLYRGAWQVGCCCCCCCCSQCFLLPACCDCQLACSAPAATLPPFGVLLILHCRHATVAAA